MGSGSLRSTECERNPSLKQSSPGSPFLQSKQKGFANENSARETWFSFCSFIEEEENKKRFVGNFGRRHCSHHCRTSFIDTPRPAWRRRRNGVGCSYWLSPRTEIEKRLLVGRKLEQKRKLFPTQRYRTHAALSVVLTFFASKIKLSSNPHGQRRIPCG